MTSRLKLFMSSNERLQLAVLVFMGRSYDYRLAPDIFISESITDEESYSFFGDTYQHPEYPYGTDKAHTILAGSQKFRSVEIEVFSQIS